ncbi:MAG: hypothetical protein ACLRXC_10740 [[Clostridium] leptum]
MRIDLLTLFPDMCETVMAENRGPRQKEGALQVCCRKYGITRDKRHSG